MPTAGQAGAPMAASLRTSLLAVVLVTTLLPLAALAYVQLDDQGDEQAGEKHAAFENRALALALRAESATVAGEDPRDALAAAAPDERVFLVDRNGTWSGTDGGAGHSAVLADLVAERLSGVADGLDPDSDAPAQLAWARAPQSERVVVIAREPPLPVASTDGAFVALLGFLGGGALVLASFLAWLVVRPVRKLERASRKLAQGELDERASVEGAREVQALATAFNRMADGLAARDRARAQRLVQKRADLAALNFAMAHEVREPLRSIRWIVDELLEDATHGSREPLGLVRAKVDDLDRLLADLMRYEHVARRDAPVADVDVAGALRRAHDHAKVAIPVELPATVPPLRGNADLLVEAFTEIIRNAEEHGATRLAVAVEQEGDEVVLRFDDDGPGIPTANREEAMHLFQRFHRAKGTGVGLSIVRRAAERHQGRAVVVASPSGGARIEMRLPSAGPLDIEEVAAPAGRRF